MHLLLVLLFSVFHFNLMGLDHSLDLIFIHFLHILLGFYEELVSSSVFLFFVLDFLFHSFYFILFLFKLLLGFMVRGHLHVFDLGFQIFNICLVPVSLGFLDQDLIWICNLESLFVFLLTVVLNLNIKNAENSVLACRKEQRVIITNPQSFNWEGVSLDFEDPLKRIFNNLDRPWFFHLSYTCEKCFSSMQLLNLWNVKTSLIP